MNYIYILVCLLISTFECFLFIVSSSDVVDPNILVSGADGKGPQDTAESLGVDAVEPSKKEKTDGEKLSLKQKRQARLAENKDDTASLLSRAATFPRVDPEKKLFRKRANDDDKDTERKNRWNSDDVERYIESEIFRRISEKKAERTERLQRRSQAQALRSSEASSKDERPKKLLLKKNNLERSLSGDDSPLSDVNTSFPKKLNIRLLAALIDSITESHQPKSKNSLRSSNISKDISEAEDEDDDKNNNNDNDDEKDDVLDIPLPPSSLSSSLRSLEPSPSLSSPDTPIDGQGHQPVHGLPLTAGAVRVVAAGLGSSFDKLFRAINSATESLPNINRISQVTNENIVDAREDATEILNGLLKLYKDNMSKEGPAQTQRVSDTRFLGLKYIREAIDSSIRFINDNDLYDGSTLKPTADYTGIQIIPKSAALGGLSASQEGERREEEKLRGEAGDDREEDETGAEDNNNNNENNNNNNSEDDNSNKVDGIVVVDSIDSSKLGTRVISNIEELMSQATDIESIDDLLSFLMNVDRYQEGVRELGRSLERMTIALGGDVDLKALTGYTFTLF